MSADAPPESLRSIQELLARGRLDDARRALDALLEAQPEDVEAHYTRAVVHRYAGRIDAARADLETVKRLVPNHGRAHQEEGHLLRALGDLEGAAAAYGRATRLNPALEASFRARLELLEQLGRASEAAVVRAQLAHLRRLPKPLVAVTDLLAQGKLLKAEALCRRFLQQA
ncbi:MAG: tetratricopeptide repeat protein, partial [Pseudomonadales bacterium]|nr:tetratricopeptide repeat protein [Pseudomonadales bacterium]